MPYLSPNQRVAILLHQGLRDRSGKTGLSFLRYGECPVVALIDADCRGESLVELTGIDRDIPIVGAVTEALAYEPDVLLIGIAPSGGQLPDAWWEEVKLGIFAGLSVVNGLHSSLQERLETLSEYRLAPQQWIWDVRQEPQGLGVGKGRARSLNCQRVLMVGTDMIVGKMSTGLELWRVAKQAGIRAQFLATGQGGLIITGTGIPLDAIRVDFAAGAVEQAALELGEQCDLLIVEGQGSLLHPGSTATLPLLRGSQATDLILVHQVGRTHINNCPDVAIPPLPDVIQLYEAVAAGAGAFPAAKVRAVALNTFHFNESDARGAIAQVEQETGLPCTDAVRFGADVLLAALG